MTVAIVLYPVPSIILSAIRLAGRLQRRGHRVCLISTPEVEDAARAEGIAFAPVLSGLFPAGSLLEQIRLYASLSGLNLWRAMRRTVRHVHARLDGLLEGDDNEIERTLREIAPDLLLIYGDTPFPALVGLMAMRRGIRCAYVSAVFYQHRGPDSPPLSSALVPGPGRRNCWRVRLAWTRLLAVRSVRDRIGLALGLDFDLPRYLRALSRRAGGAGGPLHWDCFVAPMLNLPEFILGPRALEFPIAPRDGCHWLGFDGDDVRAEGPFPWDRVDASRALVYCSFGTQLFAYLPPARRIAFLQAVIDALAARPRLQLAMATGGHLGPTDLAMRAPNAIVLDRMPQLDVLDRARLMITHCGFNSVQECARRGVPMLAFPLGFDQPGNAARVVHHGLGLRGDVRRATADDIGRQIDAMIDDDALRTRCAALAARSRDGGEEEAGMRRIEALARGD